MLKNTEENAAGLRSLLGAEQDKVSALIREQEAHQGEREQLAALTEQNLHLEELLETKKQELQSARDSVLIHKFESARVQTPEPAAPEPAPEPAAVTPSPSPPPKPPTPPPTPPMTPPQKSETASGDKPEGEWVSRKVFEERRAKWVQKKELLTGQVRYMLLNHRMLHDKH